MAVFYELTQCIQRLLNFIVLVCIFQLQVSNFAKPVNSCVLTFCNVEDNLKLDFHIEKTVPFV